jgi:hypothetical protein
MTAITITDAGRNLYRDAMKGTVVPIVKYVALGSSATTPTTGDIKLGAEIFRKAVTSYVNGATGEVIVNMYLSQSDLPGTTVQEIGFISGSGANINPNTGVLLAHGLYNHTHGVESITFALDFQVT